MDQFLNGNSYSLKLFMNNIASCGVTKNGLVSDGWRYRYPALNKEELYIQCLKRLLTPKNYKFVLKAPLRVLYSQV